MQAFIFDMDGVIIDSEPIHNKVVKEVLLENNIVVDDEEFNKLIGMTSTSVFSYFIDKHHLPYTPEEMTSLEIKSLTSVFLSFLVPSQMEVNSE